jgi:hypothetical protein
LNEPPAGPSTLATISTCAPAKPKAKSQPKAKAKPAPAPKVKITFSALAADSDSEDDIPLSELSDVSTVLGKRDRIPSPPKVEKPRAARRLVVFFLFILILTIIVEQNIACNYSTTRVSTTVSTTCRRRSCCPRRCPEEGMFRDDVGVWCGAYGLYSSQTRQKQRRNENCDSSWLSRYVAAHFYPCGLVHEPPPVLSGVHNGSRPYVTISCLFRRSLLYIVSCSNAELRTPVFLIGPFQYINFKKLCYDISEVES